MCSSLTKIGASMIACRTARPSFLHSLSALYAHKRAKCSTHRTDQIRSDHILMDRSYQIPMEGSDQIPMEGSDQIRSMPLLLFMKDFLLAGSDRCEHDSVPICAAVVPPQPLRSDQISGGQIISDPYGQITSYPCGQIRSDPCEQTRPDPYRHITSSPY